MPTALPLNDQVEAPLQGDQAPPRPSYLSVVADGVPPTLAAIPNWVTWQCQLRHDRWTKRLTTAAGGSASVTDRSTWTSFDRAIAAYLRGGFAGVGWVLDGQPVTPDGLVVAGVDLDHVTDDAGRRVRARRIIDELQSYAEWSPSGTGVRIFCLAQPLQHGINRAGVELYTSKRFLTVTGRRLGVGDV